MRELTVVPTRRRACFLGRTRAAQVVPKTGIAIGKNRGHVTTKRALPASKQAGKTKRRAKGVQVVKDIVREVRACASPRIRRHGRGGARLARGRAERREPRKPGSTRRRARGQAPR